MQSSQPNQLPVGSVLSYPDRGKWGSAAWRGNCSGYLYRDIFAQLRPSLFVDPMVGSGTSVEVAAEMGIEAVGLDLHSGFNILRDSILTKVGREADLCLSHPAYHDIVIYSGVQYPGAHPDDLSRCASVEDFEDKLLVALLNQREATRGNGHYGMVMGDVRKPGGMYHCFSAEMISRLPRSELAAVLIKQQHNCTSDSRRYAAMRYPRILHEYVVLWRKSRKVLSYLGALRLMAHQAQDRLASTWRCIVHAAMVSTGRDSVPLAQLYAAVAHQAPDRLAKNPNWMAKVRQCLQLDPRFVPVEPGIWRLAA